MKKVIARVPLRADLAGGTLDLWPLYLFHPGCRTVNVAISFHAECEITRADNESVIEIFLSDDHYERRYESVTELVDDPKAPLIARAIEHFKIAGIRIVTRTDAPRGSGLGGSSAMAIALVRALSEFAGTPVEGDALIEVVRDLETRLLKMPAGVQDYYPPVYGGLMSLHLDPGRINRHSLSLPIAELGRHFLLHYSGVQRFSGTNNWEIYKRHIEGDREIIDGLARIAAISQEMEHALETHNLRAAGKALHKEWEARKSLIRGISTPEIDAVIEIARKAGAWGGKVCGAGGGGCVVLLAPVKKREAVREALSRAPGETLRVVPVSYGLNIESEDPLRTTLAFAPRRSSKTTGSFEQLYEVGGRHGDYRPHLFAESRITYDEPRGGIHTIVVSALLAPVDVHAERVEWERAIEVHPAELQMSAVPEPGKASPPPDHRDVIVLAATEGEETLREYLVDRARLSLLHNAPFAMWSEPRESREAFLNRCLERARQLLNEEANRLESTFRRRMDQLREKAQRDVRDEEKKSPEDGSLRPPEVTIAWGQALYNLTAGKQPLTEIEPRSPTEADYFEKIAQLQRQWERERDQKKEELEANAQRIEEVVLAPNPRNIEIVRYLILWAAEANRTEYKALGVKI